jgi:hypothetical protein
MTLSGDTKGSISPGGSNFRLNITSLVNMGAVVVRDSNEYILDDFEISLIVASQDTIKVGNPHPDIAALEGMIVSPGFYTTEVEEKYTKIYTPSYEVGKQPPKYSTDSSLFTPPSEMVEVVEKRRKYCGYEWKITKEQAFVGNTYWLEMITDPSTSNKDDPGNILEDDVYGVCFPPGRPLCSRAIGVPGGSTGTNDYSYIVPVSVVVRRRPTEYTDLSLNQLYFNMPWNVDVWSDGNGQIGLTKLLFGAKGALFDPVTKEPLTVDWSTAHDFIVTLGGKTVNGTEYDAENPPTEPLSTTPVAQQILDLGGVRDSNNNVWYPTVLEQVYRVKNRPALIPIRLTYDFERTAISSNALMAFKYYSPTSTPALVEEISWYKDTADVGGMGRSQWQRTERDALASVYELPVGRWYYFDDSSSQRTASGKRVSPSQGLFKGNFQSSSPDYAFHDYSILSEPRKIFRWVGFPSDLLTQDYTYTTREIKAIEADRISTYGTNLADQSIQSNVGLLTQGLSSAQERLLALERTVYGADLDTVPGEFDNRIQSFVGRADRFFQSITDYGALRLTKQLLSLVFLSDEDPQNPGNKVRLWSWWPNVLSEVLGWVESTDPNKPYGTLHNWRYVAGDDPPNFTASKTASGLLPDKISTTIGGNVAEVFFQVKYWLTDYYSLSTPGAVKNISPWKGSDIDLNVNFVPNTGWFRADHIFFKKSLNSYFSTVSNDYKSLVENSDRDTLANKPYLVSYTGSDSHKFADYAFNAVSLGKSDATADSPESYASQSLEGVINDLAIRIVHWKSQYDVKYGIMRSDISMYSVTDNTNYEDQMLKDEETGFYYTYLKAGYENTAVSFTMDFLKKSYTNVRWFDYTIPLETKNKFVTALGMDQRGKIQVPSALILKGIVNRDEEVGFLEEYVNAKSITTDYDRVNLIDSREPNQRDTRLPILGVYGTWLPAFTHGRAPRKQVFSMDPNYISRKKDSSSHLKDEGYNHSLRPSVFRVVDQNSHPNYQRYVLESVLDVPNSRKWSKFNQDTNLTPPGSESSRRFRAPDRVAFDLALYPEREIDHQRNDFKTPNKAISLSNLNQGNNASYITLPIVPKNYHGLRPYKSDNNSDFYDAYETKTAGPVSIPNYVTYSDIPVWARMKKDGNKYQETTTKGDNDLPYGITFFLNAHQTRVPKIPVTSEWAVSELPRIKTIVYPLMGADSSDVPLKGVWYNYEFFNPDNDPHGTTGIPPAPGEQGINGAHKRLGRVVDESGAEVLKDIGTLANVYEKMEKIFVYDPDDKKEEGYFHFETTEADFDETTSTVGEGSAGSEGFTVKSTPAAVNSYYWMWYFEYQDKITGLDIIRASDNPMVVGASGATYYEPKIILEKDTNLMIDLVGVSAFNTGQFKYYKMSDVVNGATIEIGDKNFTATASPVGQTTINVSDAESEEIEIENVFPEIIEINIEPDAATVDIEAEIEEISGTDIEVEIDTLTADAKAEFNQDTLDRIDNWLNEIVDWVADQNASPPTGVARPTTPTIEVDVEFSNVDLKVKSAKLNNAVVNVTKAEMLLDPNKVEIKMNVNLGKITTKLSGTGTVELPTFNISGKTDAGQTTSAAINILPANDKYIIMTNNDNSKSEDGESVRLITKVSGLTLGGSSGISTSDLILKTEKGVYLPDTVYKNAAEAVSAEAMVMNASGKFPISQMEFSSTQVDSEEDIIARKNKGLGDVDTLKYWYQIAISSDKDGYLMENPGYPSASYFKRRELSQINGLNPSDPLHDPSSPMFNLDVSKRFYPRDSGGIMITSDPGIDSTYYNEWLITAAFRSDPTAQADLITNSYFDTKANWIDGSDPSVVKTWLETQVTDDPRTIPVTRQQIPTSWNYDRINSVTYKTMDKIEYETLKSISYKRVQDVKYDRFNGGTIKKPLEIDGIRAESFYTENRDLTGTVKYERAKSTVMTDLPDQHQTVTILKNQLSSLGNFDIHFPKTTTLDTGLKLVESTSTEDVSGHLKDSDLQWNLDLKNYQTLEDLMGEYLKKDTGAQTYWDNYVSISEYNPDATTLSSLQTYMSNVEKTSSGEVKTLLNKIITRLANIQNEMISTTYTSFSNPDVSRKLEMHVHGMLDGTAMPEQALWIDIPNSELYLKFQKHIDKIMKLVVRVERPLTKMESTTELIVREKNMDWPWNNPSKGLAQHYPITYLDTDVLLPDIFSDKEKTSVYSYTFESIMNNKGVTADQYVEYYERPISSLSGLVDTSVFTTMYKTAEMSSAYTENDIIKPGMKFWSVIAQLNSSDFGSLIGGII